MGRLDGLTGYLAQYEDDGVILTFDEVEALMGSRLPRSARKANSPFWDTRRGNVYAKAWSDAGFVATFDECGDGEVCFMRASVVQAASASGEVPPTAASDPGATADAATATADPEPGRPPLPPPPPDLSTLPAPPETPADKAARIAVELSTAFTEGGFLPGMRGTLLSGWEALPEVVVARALQARQADPLWVRLLLTFGAVLDRGRGDPARWSAILAAFDAEVALFDPDAVVARSLTDLAGALEDVELTRRAGEVAAWRVLAEALTEPSSVSALPDAVYEGRGQADALLRELTVPSSSSGRMAVAGLSRHRAAVRWIRMLVFPGGAELDALASLPVVVDADVRRATEFLGVTDTSRLNRAEATRVIDTVWQQACAGAAVAGPPELAGTAVALDQALAFHGRVGCGWCKAKLTIEPFTKSCDGCRLRPTT